MTKILTQRQQKILQFIKQYIDNNASSPTYREIMKHFHISSLSSIHKHITALMKKGFITKEKYLTKSLSLNTKTNISSTSSQTYNLPFIGHINKQGPIKTFPKMQTLIVPSYMVQSIQKTYALCIQGNDFIHQNILDADFILIESNPHPNWGDLTLSSTKQNQMIIGYYYPEGNKIRFGQKTASTQDLTFHTKEINIFGTIKGLIRLN